MNVKDLKRSIKQAANKAGSGGGHNINVARRSNIIVAANTGEEGATEHASATQTTHIEQHSGHGDEDTPATSTDRR